MPSLEFSPLIPTAAWLAAAAAAAAFLAWRILAARRRVPGSKRWGLASGMTLSLALPLLFLLNPAWVELVPPPAERPLLTILVDGSASMATRDAPDGSSRYRFASRAALRVAEAASESCDVRVRVFAVGSAGVDVEQLGRLSSTGPQTDLAAAISAGLATDRNNGQALFLLTDGIHNAGDDERVLAAAVRAKGAAPIFVQPVGGDVDVRDIELLPRAPQEFAFPGEKVRLTVAVGAVGFKEGAVRVALLLDGKEVAFQTVDLAEGSARDASLEVQPEKSGLYRYEARAETVEGEVSGVNNSATIELRVVDRPLRVLVLEGKPHPDAEVLLRTLSRERALAPAMIVHTSDGSYLQRSLKVPAAGADGPPPTVPPAEIEERPLMGGPGEVLAPERLREYEILVLGRDAEAFLNDETLGHVTNWLAREGGTLVCYRGAPALRIQPRLARLLPAPLPPSRDLRFPGLPLGVESFRCLLPGQENVLSRLPKSTPATEPNLPKPRAVVLATHTSAEGESTPAVACQPIGAGKVVVVEEEGMWNWAFLGPQQQEPQQVYTGLWRGLVRALVSQGGLAADSPLALRADKVVFNEQELITFTLAVRGEAGGARRGDMPRIDAQEFHLLRNGEVVAGTLPAPAGEGPGLYRLFFRNQPQGRYEARLASGADGDASERATVEVRPTIREQLDLDARPDLLARLAQETSGAVIAPSEDQKLIDLIQAHAAKLPATFVRRATSLSGWWVFVGIAAIWCATWGLHRKWRSE
ncbi:MAG: hypothetical protein HYS13_19275 [Planctomycetia bacterium]|nr:hypothetical protein [Planctomycetia bacterium]